jgi:hypothetical protein
MSSASVPTKIYIKNYDPLLIKKKFGKLDEYFRNKEVTVDIFSPDGLFMIENNRLFKLKPVDKDVVTHMFEGHELLFDSSYYEREQMVSQIPYDHISMDVVKYYFYQEALGKKSFLRLVIEGIIDDKPDILSMPDINNNYNKYKNFTPTNFYFLANESFDNILVKKELNVFLSLLK